MTKIRVLLLTQVLPYPPDSGGKIKAYNLIRYLAQAHRVTLVSFIRSEGEQALCAHLAPYCERIETVVLRRSRFSDGMALMRSLLSDVPFLIVRDRVSEMAALVRRVAREVQPDVLHVVQLNMAQYVLEIPDIPKILDQENAVSSVAERLYRLQRPGPAKLLTRLEWRKLRHYEAEACSQFDCVLTVTEQDRQALQALTSGKGRFAVVPIGIDCDAVRPIGRQPDARNIITIGNLHWPPNADGILWFAREIFPLVRQQIPEARFYVVGKNPPREVRQLQSSYPPPAIGHPPSAIRHQLSATSHLPSAISHQPIVVTGYVEDPTPYFADSAVFIVPLRAGGGMRVKILDAWARGIPIVSTTIGCEGIEVQDEDNILVADTPQDFAQAVVRVIRDMELTRRLAENGRRWVEEKYNWRVVYGKFDDVYRQLETVSGTQ